MAKAFDDAGKSEIIVGHTRSRRWEFRRRSARVVVGEADECKARIISFLFELSEFFEDEIRSHLIGDLHGPSDIIARRVGSNALDGRLTCKNNFVCPFPGPKTGHVVWRPFFTCFAVLHPWLHEFAVVADRLAMQNGVIPDESSRGVRQSVGFVVTHSVGVTTREAGKALFEIGGRERGRAPLMTVGAQNTTAVSIV